RDCSTRSMPRPLPCAPSTEGKCAWTPQLYTVKRAWDRATRRRTSSMNLTGTALLFSGEKREADHPTRISEMTTTPSAPKRILSGVQPSGKLHLGNYFGAIRQHIALQDEEPCFYFIADYHALTTIDEAARRRLGNDKSKPADRAATLRENTRDV